MFYTGIGSRKPAGGATNQMWHLASLLVDAGYTLRSGGADGSDTAFERGCDNRQGKKSIYLPWAGFNRNPSKLSGVGEQAMEIASNIHPYWAVMREPIRLLMARNVYEVLGYNLQTPSKFVVCWTPDGCESHNCYSPEKTGGTGLAIALATKRGIPVYNLKNEGRYQTIVDLVKKTV